MRYWDSSAIVPLVVGESLSKAAADCLRADAGIITWWVTPVECVSALARREREGNLTAAGMSQAIKRLAVSGHVALRHANEWADARGTGAGASGVPVFSGRALAMPRYTHARYCRRRRERADRGRTAY